MQERLVLEGLDHVGRGAQLDRLPTVLFAGARSNHDDRCVLELRLAAKTSQQLIAIHSRHFDIQQNDVRWRLQIADLLQRVDTISRRYWRPVGALNQVRQSSPDANRVVDDHDRDVLQFRLWHSDLG